MYMYTVEPSSLLRTSSSEIGHLSNQDTQYLLSLLHREVYKRTSEIRAPVILYLHVVLVVVVISHHCDSIHVGALVWTLGFRVTADLRTGNHVPLSDL